MRSVPKTGQLQHNDGAAAGSLRLRDLSPDVHQASTTGTATCKQGHGCRWSHRRLDLCLRAQVRVCVNPFLTSPLVYFSSAAFQLLLIIVVKYQTCFIHAPARAQLREFLVSFVFPGDLTTQMLFRDHVQTVVHARIRHFRDSVGRTLRQHQPATRRRCGGCGIGPDLSSSGPSSMEVESMAATLRRAEHRESGGLHVGTATLRSLSSPESNFCSSMPLHDGEQPRQSRVEDGQNRHGTDYSLVGPRGAASKAGFARAAAEAACDQGGRRIDALYKANNGLSERACRVVAPVWDNSSVGEREETTRRHPSHAEAAVLTANVHTSCRGRSHDTAAESAEGFHRSGRRARRTNARPGPGQLFEQLHRVMQLARDNEGRNEDIPLWDQQPAQLESLLRLADPGRTAGAQNTSHHRRQGPGDPEKEVSVWKADKGGSGKRLPGLRERVAEASGDGATRSRTKRRRGDDDRVGEPRETNLAGGDSEKSPRSGSSRWRSEVCRSSNSDASRLFKGESVTDPEDDCRIRGQSRSTEGSTEPDGQRKEKVMSVSRRFWRTQAGTARADVQNRDTGREPGSDQTNRWIRRDQSWERSADKVIFCRSGAVNSECREKAGCGPGKVPLELGDTREGLASFRSDNRK